MNNATNNDISRLDTEIKNSTSILVVGHINPDPDALASLSFMFSHLKEFYKKPKVTVAAEKISTARNYVPGFNNITHGALNFIIEQAAPDLVIFVDFSQKHMISRENATEVMEYIQKGGIPLVVIDHHPNDLMDVEPDIYINLAPTSTCTNLYEIFGRQLKNEITATQADALLYGIVADTEMFRFSYGEDSQKPLLEMSGELLDIANTDLESISNQMKRSPVVTWHLIAQLLKNLRLLTPDVALTTLEEFEIDEIGSENNAVSEAATYVANNVVSLVENAKIGVLIYPAGAAENTFTVRFRSSDENYPVNGFASDLGGGGHKQSASARVTATSLDEAIEIVRKTISS